MAEKLREECQRLRQEVMKALADEAALSVWANCMKGQAGVLVSAGPSLSKNGEVLGRAEFADRFVMVATAAAAGSLRVMQLRPQWIATTEALSEATRIWLQQLRAKYIFAGGLVNAFEDGVDIAAHEGLVDSLLGYCVLRYLGCDPVVLVGFDLAFIDGIAHARGNELDLQWGAQISPVRSWDWWHTHRIVAHSKQLKREDEPGEQSVMTNQALHRERLLLEAAFAQDCADGLRVMDATEGGVVKKHAQVQGLAECLSEFAKVQNTKVKWVKATRKAATDVGAHEAGAAVVEFVREAPRVVAVLAIDPVRGGTGVERSLELEFGGRTVLRRTVDRLLQSDAIEHVCLVAPQDWDHRAALEDLELSSHLHIVRVTDSVFGAGHADKQSARAWSDSCSRGGIANLSVFDEVFSAKASVLACEHTHSNAVFVVGADWPLIAVNEAWGIRGLLERWRSCAQTPTFVCSLAPAGTGGCLLSLEIVRALESGSVRSIGQLIEQCADDHFAQQIIQAPHFVATFTERLIMDTPRCIHRIRRALEPLLHGSEISALEQFAALDRHASAAPTFVAQFLGIELNTGRRGCGFASPHRFGTLQRLTMTPKRMSFILARVAEARDVVVTLGGAGDPLVHPDVIEFAKQIRAAGALALSVRSELLSPDYFEKISSIQPDLIMVDLHATRADEYVRMMGFDRFTFAQNALESVIRSRHCAVGAPDWVARPWVLPCIERLRNTVDRIVEFGERWQNRAGGYCVDAPPQVDPWGDIIADAPLSATGSSLGLSQQDRLALNVLSDGRVPANHHDVLGTSSVGNVDDNDLLTLFRSVGQNRMRAFMKQHEHLSLNER